MKFGHNSAECKRSKLCVHCGDINSHHRSLCLRKYKAKILRARLSESANYTDECSDEQNDVYQCEENVLVSSGEMVLMQTAKTEIKNPINSKRQEVRLLFDSGSQRMHISKRLATKLGLKGEKEEELKLITFGSEKLKVIKTKSTNLSIKLNNGKYLNICANIVPVVSGNVQRKSMDSASIEHLRSFIKEADLADDIPVKNESSRLDLFIGNEYYLDIVLSLRIELQPGLYLLASKVG